MSKHDQAWQETRIDEILESNIDDVSKVRQIMHLGFEGEVADEIVERHQLGTVAPVYYETLVFDDYDDEDDSST